MAVPVRAQSSAVFTWAHNPLNAGTWPACSRSVRTMCQTGYTLSDVTTASAPVVISSTIAESALTYTLTPLPSVGAHIYDLVINGKGRSGNAVQSAPATVTVTVPFKTSSPHTGFAATALSPSVVFTGASAGNPIFPACSTKVTALCLTACTLSDTTNASSPVLMGSSIGNVLTYALNPSADGRFTFSRAPGSR